MLDTSDQMLFRYGLNTLDWNSFYCDEYLQFRVFDTSLIRCEMHWHSRVLVLFLHLFFMQFFSHSNFMECPVVAPLNLTGLTCAVMVCLVVAWFSGWAMSPIYSANPIVCRTAVTTLGTIGLTSFNGDTLRDGMAGITAGFRVSNFFHSAHFYCGYL